MNRNDRKIMKLEIEIDRIIAGGKTNHILHLLLSIFTGGLWLIIWLLVSASNDVSGKVKRLEKQIIKLENENEC